MCSSVPESVTLAGPLTHSAGALAAVEGAVVSGTTPPDTSIASIPTVRPVDRVFLEPLYSIFRTWLPGARPRLPDRLLMHGARCVEVGGLGRPAIRVTLAIPRELDFVETRSMSVPLNVT